MAVSAHTFDAFVTRHALDSRALCAAIVEAEEGSIAVRNRRAAVDNLTRIIEATLRLANRKGFAAMTLRELARESGLSLGGLYAYIGSKDELARLIQRRVSRTRRDVMERALAEVQGVHARLGTAIEAHLMTSEALREWFFFLYMEAHHLAADERRTAIAMEQRSEAEFAAIIEQGQAEGVFNDRPAAITAGLIKALLQDWYLKRHKHGERGLDVAGYARIVTAAAEAMLAPDTPPPEENRP